MKSVRYKYENPKLDLSIYTYIYTLYAQQGRAPGGGRRRAFAIDYLKKLKNVRYTYVYVGIDVREFFFASSYT
jgi:hypothetical protein